MKRILKSLLTISVVAAVMVSATSAVWTAQTKVKNANSFHTGNADLQIWDYNYYGKGWQEEIDGPGFDNIYPNWTQDYSLKVKNNGSTNLVLNLKGKLESGWQDDKTLRSQIKVRVWKFDDDGDYHWDGESGSWLGPEQTLNDWRSNPLVAGQLAAGDQQWFLLRFSVGDLGDTYQGATLSGYSFIFDGTTDGATQPTPSPLP
jgi:hypothetical protein